jgi:hypothetical protein
MRLYYLIWVDLIIRAKSQPANKNNWQVMTMIFMTLVMAVDLLFLITILEKYILGYFFYELEIPIIPQEIGDPISFAILFAGPPLVINYLLIFRNRRYEKLIKNYEYNGGKLAVTYLLLGLFIPTITIFIAVIYGLV